MAFYGTPVTLDWGSASQELTQVWCRTRMNAGLGDLRFPRLGPSVERSNTGDVVQEFDEGKPLQIKDAKLLTIFRESTYVANCRNADTKRSFALNSGILILVCAGPLGNI